jgi:hypothetical protein
MAFLGKQKTHDQSLFSNKILIFDSVTKAKNKYVGFRFPDPT